ncbi:LEAF RUST 10 DISEASE-RESISTANCE LOCUS RECEPTOR-LIKE PROTEIN KINASE-like 2.4 [Vicia villosa]|uniref:LEAF RUST 10 DISEASE-RESISTANCE LOCUS RECEPTOR-LIKE PROTEIN KINASE-like 2.4 n=1 Tax=Vicia villosa TaxID=3911 RepID=UPI00273A859B|nr:LEAF RUST 10 DISEASE-RESISTANCE LOCUS RECEPTOR-LIKE PROTEIN KINASE-like 2.4 [Vicia villosa]
MLVRVRGGEYRCLIRLVWKIDCYRRIHLRSILQFNVKHNSMALVDGVVHLRFLLFYHLILLLLLILTSKGSGHSDDCPVSFDCGNLGFIGYPFTKVGFPNCGALAIRGCDDHNKAAVKSIQLTKGGKPFQVTKIVNYFFKGNPISIIDQNFMNLLMKSACDVFTYVNITIPPPSPFGTLYMKDNITAFKCNRTQKLITNPPSNFFKNSSCPNYDFYFGDSISDGESNPTFTSCSLFHLPVIGLGFALSGNPYPLLAHEITYQFQLSEECIRCHRDTKGHCRAHNNGQIYCPGNALTKLPEIVKMKGRSSNWKLRLVSAVVVVVAIGVGVLMLLAYCIKKKIVPAAFLLFRKKSSTNQIIEDFLKEHGHLPAARYSYSDVKKITNSFRNKLGQGGFGSVYKGKLHDERVVAVKVLSESKGNGEDFINEVASISRTSHVNIVRLLGFCLDGSKKALIYEFMSNGSLEKFIYEEKNALKDDHQLNCKILYDIAVGVARGLEYLHRGCNTRILHFDIKPHNILLDEDLCPKISDFGLAKICLKNESIVSVFGARGTPGYIAPELFSRNFGGVSHKSDVYSYGMMVLEMVGRRKNIKVEVDCSSELYFPHWIYKRLELNQDLGLKCVKNEIDEEMVRKMTVVSLWCIQTDPSNRPSMRKVVEMLEGSLQVLEIPPKPFLSSPSTSSIHVSSEML